jgi:hypothetical protein
MRLKETYGNDEYKKMRAAEMINYRKSSDGNAQIVNNMLTNETQTAAKNNSNINNKDIVTNKNKKTDEEKREEARLKKQRQRAELKEKYGDEEYKKMRAIELATYRKNKQAD